MARGRESISTKCDSLSFHHTLRPQTGPRPFTPQLSGAYFLCGPFSRTNSTAAAVFSHLQLRVAGVIVNLQRRRHARALDSSGSFVSALAYLTPRAATPNHLPSRRSGASFSVTPENQPNAADWSGTTFRDIVASNRNRRLCPWIVPTMTMTLTHPIH